jgi:hypothetical protein
MCDVVRFAVTRLVPVLGLVHLWGCGTDCADACEQAREECGQNAFSRDGDCQDLCDRQESLNEELGCTAQFDEYLTCLDESAPDCEDGCSDQYEAVEDCTKPFCDAHQSDDRCWFG